MIINTQTVKKSSGGNNNYSVLGGILDDNEMIYPSTKTPEGTVFIPSDNPADYTKVDWIQGTGTQYIDMGFTFNSDCRIRFDYIDYDITTSNRFVGARTAGDKKVFVIYGQNQASTLGFRGNNDGYGDVVVSNVQTQVANGGTIEYLGRSVQNNCVYTDLNNVKYTLTLSNTFSTEYNLHLIGNNNAGNAEPAKYKAKGFQITRSGINYNLIPVYHTDTGILGMFDAVNNKFHMNAGTGDFTKPSDTSGEINLAEYLASLT